MVTTSDAPSQELRLPPCSRLHQAQEFRFMWTRMHYTSPSSKRMFSKNPCIYLSIYLSVYLSTCGVSTQTWMSPEVFEVTAVGSAATGDRLRAAQGAGPPPTAWGSYSSCIHCPDRPATGAQGGFLVSHCSSSIQHAQVPGGYRTRRYTAALSTAPSYSH